MKIKCDMCDGTGKYWVSPEDNCKNCLGTGQVEIPSPTTEGQVPWLQALGRSQGHPSWNKGGPGKWLLFVNKKNIDDAWQLIRQETLAENLGCSSKVSTKKSWLEHGMPEDYVICVNTPNCEDKDDINRVRDHLRHLGFTDPIGYKSDKETKEKSHDC